MPSTRSQTSCTTPRAAPASAPPRRAASCSERACVPRSSMRAADQRGPNTGRWNGEPPAGRPAAVRGVKVFAVEAGKIPSAEGYFDRQGLAEQLGFQMRPLPPVAGPFQFGYAVRASAGSSEVPGAFSLTWIDARSEAEAEEIKLTAAVVAAELAQQP